MAAAGPIRTTVEPLAICHCIHSFIHPSIYTQGTCRTYFCVQSPVPSLLPVRPRRVFLSSHFQVHLPSSTLIYGALLSSLVPSLVAGRRSCVNIRIIGSCLVLVLVCGPVLVLISPSGMVWLCYGSSSVVQPRCRTYYKSINASHLIYTGIIKTSSCRPTEREEGRASDARFMQSSIDNHLHLVTGLELLSSTEGEVSPVDMNYTRKREWLPTSHMPSSPVPHAPRLVFPDCIIDLIFLFSFASPHQPPCFPTIYSFCLTRLSGLSVCAFTSRA